MTPPTTTGHQYRRVSDVPIAYPPALVHPEWDVRFPWLVQGTTIRGPGREPFDLGLYSGGSPEADVRRRWSELVTATGLGRAVHARQLHESTVRPQSPGATSSEPRSHGILDIVDDCDGHTTAAPGVVLTVAVADCVPVFLVDAERQAVSAVHAGWRGAAGGVLEAGFSAMGSEYGSRPENLDVHFGPSICATCYEVGPEVFEALGQPVPDDPAPIDLRTVLAERAVQAGVWPDRITISTHCTLCTDSGLFSHRGGDRFRQVGYIGIRRTS